MGICGGWGWLGRRVVGGVSRLFSSWRAISRRTILCEDSQTIRDRSSVRASTCECVFCR